MIRAFIAVEIDPAVLERIFVAIDDLKQAIPHIRWTPQANCHLTLKFLGAVDAGQVESIAQALEHELSLFPRHTINAKGLGVFPDAKRPRILWVGLHGKQLATLAEKIEITLAPLGFEKEQRPFTPHLTSGRWRESKESGRKLPDILARWKDHDFGVSKVHEVKLFQSILKPAGSQYVALKALRLASK